MAAAEPAGPASLSAHRLQRRRGQLAGLPGVLAPHSSAYAGLLADPAARRAQLLHLAPRTPADTEMAEPSADPARTRPWGGQTARAGCQKKLAIRSVVTPERRG